MSESPLRNQQNSSQGSYHKLHLRPISDASKEQDEMTAKMSFSKHDRTRTSRNFEANSSQQLEQPTQKTQTWGLAQTSWQGEEEETKVTFAIEQQDLTLLETGKTEILAFGMNAPEAPYMDTLDKSNAASKKYTTMPTLVLNGLVTQQGKPLEPPKSEVSAVASAAGLVGIGNVLGSVLRYGFIFLIQYTLGPGLYGLYTLALSIISLISSIFSLGLDSAMLRYVAIYRGKQQTSTLRGLMVFCTTLVGLAGLVGALLLLFFTPPLVAFWSTLRPGQVSSNKQTLVQLTPLLQMMAPMIPLICLQVVWFGGLRGFKAFKWYVLAVGILQSLMQILLLLVILHLFRGVVGVALVILISVIITTVLYLYLLFREYSQMTRPAVEKYELREWLAFSTLNFLTTIIETVLDSIDTLLLAFFGISKVAIGQYGAAIKFSPFILMPLGTFNTIFAPTIAELHNKGDKQKLEEMFKIVTKWSITFSFPIFLVVILFSPYLLALSGRGYVDAWPLAIAFAIGCMVSAGTGAVGAMLQMTGHNKLSFLNSIVAVTVNLVLGILLTPRYGAMGTALSTGLAICANNLMRLIQVRLVLKMLPYRWDTLKPIGAGLISSAVIGALLYLLRQVHVHDTFLLGHAVLSLELGFIPIFLATYAGLLILFKMSPEDEIILTALRKKFKGIKRPLF